MGSKTMQPIFTDKDKGCWIDGAFGERHALQKMKAILPDRGNWEILKDELQACIDGDEDEFIDETLRGCVNALEIYTQPGLYWLWEAGDLILTDEMED